MARCPTSPELQRLAVDYGCDLERFSPLNDDCVVCGLCTRACEAVTGRTLSLAGRGTAIHVDTAFQKASTFCIGCGACVQICPVKKIAMEDVDGERRIILHGKIASRVKLPQCTSCGKYFGPVIDLKQVMERMGEHLIPPPNAAFVRIAPDGIWRLNWENDILNNTAFSKKKVRLMLDKPSFNLNGDYYSSRFSELGKGEGDTLILNLGPQHPLHPRRASGHRGTGR